MTETTVVSACELPSTHDVDPSVARSWLLVNAAHQERFDEALSSRADQMVLDIEDAVDPAAKPAARANAVDWLAGRGQRAWVRINDHSTPFWSEDIDALKGVPGLRGVMLAKTEAAEHVSETFDRLGGSTPVLALIESALGIEEAVSIARARGCFRLAFGSGDYRRDTGTSADDLAMVYPRSRLVVASRIGGLPGPIDGPAIGATHTLIREQSETAVALGLTGKLCLQPEQVAVVNQAVSPAVADVSWALEFIADFAARGGVIRDGSDLPRLGRARKIEALARAFGICSA
jgi:citrate lyase subunit beta/citryl-CoA lyase